MSLYGNLPEAKHPESGSNDPNPWSTASKLQPAFRSRFAPPPSVLKRNKSGVPPPSRNSTAQVAAGHSVGGEESGVGFSLFGDVDDLYDPAKPNDYEEVIQERERKKRDAEIEAEKQELIRKEQERKDRDSQRDHKRDRSYDRSNSPSSEDNDMGDRRGQRRKSSRDASPVRNHPASSSSQSKAGKDKGMSLAQKMLEKMGWREGEGLGKARQGMATPLIAQKTDKRSAVIVNAEHRKPVDMPPPEKRPRTGAILDGAPTKVVLLRNMVGPGEVDDELEDEVAQELQKFGRVTRVLIFEVTEPDFPATEAVRIFVEFERTEEATKAAVALQGRFFGGRTVKAGFYDEEKFDACDLAPVPGEFTNAS